MDQTIRSKKGEYQLILSFHGNSLLVVLLRRNTRDAQ
jgi:hypothetical protein